VGPIEALVARYGTAGRCRVRAADVAVLDLEDLESDAVGKLRREIAIAIEADRAEAIVLGCAGMAELARALFEEFNLPVIDGVAAAVKQCEALVALGLKTAKRGAYANPLRKRYDGILSGFAIG
jgi:allantoin racemase